MLNKYSVLIGITISLLFMVIATRVYPGGSLFNKHSVGFDWTTNFISNLFGAQAVNGANNPARIFPALLVFTHFDKSLIVYATIRESCC